MCVCVSFIEVRNIRLAIVKEIEDEEERSMGKK